MASAGVVAATGLRGLERTPPGLGVHPRDGGDFMARRPSRVAKSYGRPGGRPQPPEAQTGHAWPRLIEPAGTTGVTPTMADIRACAAGSPRTGWHTSLHQQKGSRYQMMNGGGKTLAGGAERALHRARARCARANASALGDAAVRMWQARVATNRATNTKACGQASTKMKNWTECGVD